MLSCLSLCVCMCVRYQIRDGLIKVQFTAEVEELCRQQVRLSC